ncbi:hypothetical protein C7H19_19900 [Aphanothece hegewaldii CCALA 016]|uniref:DUF2808 domain-containing protein n=1 Tax=Aphanothece hegewaldii CCALA 016 TaxID=2107694 RepID=A0A2T1LTA2_9CHRO|nr:hypothetical protein [Aphanothece hegewaldii]PSF33650.1 hypothetical protein C7H19_19900 [Aphanothece hegewaldii CCALA 016]
MNKTLIAAVLTIFTTISISAVYADSIGRSKVIPSVINANQFPSRKARFARHTIRIHIPPESRGISELSIEIPAGVIIKNDITVHNKSGQKFEVNSSINETRVTLDFPEGFVPQEILEIELNKVILPRFYPIWRYRVYAKLEDSNIELSIGVAEVRTRL